MQGKVVYRRPDLNRQAGKPAGTYSTQKKYYTKSCILKNRRGYAVLEITNKHNFQADVLDKIIDGNNNPTMGTGGSGLDKKKNFIPYVAYSQY